MYIYYERHIKHNQNAIDEQSKNNFTDEIKTSRYKIFDAIEMIYTFFMIERFGNMKRNI